MIVDDHALFREGLRLMLSTSFNPLNLRLVQDGQAALELALRWHPDIVLSDIDMPQLDGFGLVKQLKAKSPEVKVIVISIFQDEAHLSGMHKLAADGYLHKDTSPTELKQAIDAVLRNEIYVSQHLAHLVYPSHNNEMQPLSGREKEVLSMIVQGKTSQDIAENLGLSRRTIESHRARIMSKLNMDNLAHLVRYAVEHGMA